MDDKGLVAWMEKNGPAVESLVAATKKEFAVAAVRLLAHPTILLLDYLTLLHLNVDGPLPSNINVHSL